MNAQSMTGRLRSGTPQWMKRFAWALPLFFLLKGLLWLSVPTLLWWVNGNPGGG
ncbi:MAG: hypothetical protein ABW101_11185 [Candidatus Thiodiazotropha sp.]